MKQKPIAPDYIEDYWFVRMTDDVKLQTLESKMNEIIQYLQYLDEQAELHAKSGQHYSADYQRTLLRNAEELHKQKDTEKGKEGDAI